MLFAAVEEPQKVFKMLKQPSLANSEVFLKLSDTSQSSLQGRIACQNILLNVPNRNTFQLVLKAVRFWAHQRGLYSVNCGYLGGITLAVMVARVCQDFPDLEAACTVFKFFEVYAESGWREPVQILLQKGYKGSRGGGLRQGMLDAVDQYSNDVMVVLTPND